MCSKIENTFVLQIFFCVKWFHEFFALFYRYGLYGTDLLKVDELTGSVSVIKEIDREEIRRDEIGLTVTIQDEAEEAGQPPNIVR